MISRHSLRFLFSHTLISSSPFLLRFITQKGVTPNRLFIDCGYTSFENIARACVYWDIQIRCNIAKDWVYHEEATLKGIDHWYNKLWKQPYFKINSSFMDKVYALMMSDERRFELVGKYFRNHILTEYEEYPDRYLDH